jgi:addiction module HigA family antidote
VLRDECLRPLGITQVALAGHLGIPLPRIHEIVRGRRGVTPETAWLLAGAFDTTPQSWVNLQALPGLARTRPRRKLGTIDRTA